MKNLLFILLFFFQIFHLNAQGTLPESFFDGKSVVLVSSDPGARPIMTWTQVADSVHQSLVAAGADPIAYFELEKVALSEAVQADYAQSLNKRMVRNIIIITRQKNSSSIHVGMFSADAKIITSTSLFGIQAADLKVASDQFSALSQNRESNNLLVIDVPEFLAISNDETSSNQKFIATNPLNLDVFKLGVPIDGTSAESGFLSYFRYDMYGKTQATILAEQASQKAGIEQILKSDYPNQVEWLTEAKTVDELIKDKVQFVLMKVEGRESDMMKSMGVESASNSPRIVYKYYIKLLVRDELYVGPEWDADPDWRVALRNFLSNLKK
jgi:hypothetical protein